MKSPAKPTPSPITPAQVRDARAALGWSPDRLGARSNMTAYGILKYERHGRVAIKRGQSRDFDALASIRAALEGAGVEFVDEIGGAPGVRLKTS